MTAARYSDPISAMPTNEQLLRGKRMYAKFQIDISKSEGLIRVYTHRRSDGLTEGMAKSTQLMTLIIYIFVVYTL